MKILLLHLLVVLLSCSSQITHRGMIILDVYNASYSTVIRVDTISVDSALVRWHTDSLGCLGERTVVLAQELIKQLKIVGKSHAEVIQILGKPNNVYYEDLYVGSIKKDGTFLVLEYNIEQECIDGNPIDKTTNHHNAIHVTIDLQLNSVVSSSFGG